MVSAGAPLAELDPAAFFLAPEEAQVSVDQAEASYRRASALRDLALAKLSASVEAMVAQRLLPESSKIQPGTAVMLAHDISEWRMSVLIP